VVTIRQYTIPEFRAYLQDYHDRGAKLRASFLHHTWSPTPADWQGMRTMEGIRSAHKARGFSDIACHAYAAPDGTVYNGRPPTTNNCACQAPEKAYSQWPPELQALTGGNKSWCNAYGFGIETVGNFDSEDPAKSVAMRTALDVLADVHRIWGIPVVHCFFHRDVSSKTCPGSRVTKAWVHAQLEARLHGDAPVPTGDPRVVLLPGNTVIECRAKLEGRVTRADLRPLAEALGYTVTAHIADQGKVYLTPKSKEVTP